MVGSLRAPIPFTYPETKWPNISAAMLSLMIPVSLDEQLLPGTLAFAIHTLVENRMDLSVLDANYQNGEIGRHAYDPEILLKVV